MRPATVLIIGSNGDGFPELTAKFVRNVVVIDPDETVVDDLYRSAKKHNITLLPLVMDIRRPTPGCGVCYKEWPPATERISCDLVCALDLIHDLVFQRGLIFDQIAEIISAFSKKWLLVEFVTHRSKRIRNSRLAGHFEWYTLDNFMHSLRKQFALVIVHEAYRDERFLLLCEKRSKKA